MPAKRVGAGVYINDGKIEFDIPELLELLGVEDTEENRDMCVDLAEKAARASGLLSETAKVIHRHKHRCLRCSRNWSHDGKRKKCPLPTKAQCPACNS